MQYVQLKSILLFVLSALFLSLNAQENQLEIFSDMGEKFTLYLNGAKQNEAPTENVLLKDLPSPSYKARIEFEDKSKGTFMDNIYTPMNMNEPGRNTYMITLGRKGYKLKFRVHTPMADLPVDPEPEYVPDNDFASHEVQSNNTQIDMQTNSQISEENVNVSMNIGGTQIGVNVSTTSTQMGMDMPNENMDAPIEEAPASASSGLCDSPMSTTDFKSALQSIKSKSFEDSKEQLASQIVKSNCLSSEQIRDVMKVFDFEETRLDFAKKSYSYVFDPNAYYKVNDAFEFELSIEELDEYLERQ
jgi:hypothetical protein